MFAILTIQTTIQTSLSSNITGYISYHFPKIQKQLKHIAHSHRPTGVPWDWPSSRIHSKTIRSSSSRVFCSSHRYVLHRNFRARFNGKWVGLMYRDSRLLKNVSHHLAVLTIASRVRDRSKICFLLVAKNIYSWIGMWLAWSCMILTPRKIETQVLFKGI